MCATTLLTRLLDLPGTVAVDPGVVAGRAWWGRGGCSGWVDSAVAGVPGVLVCDGARYDTRGTWTRRGGILIWGGRVCWVRMRQRRLRCPEHGVRAEGVPFARAGAGFARDFEQLVAWLSTKSDKTTICAFTQIGWRTQRRRTATPGAAPHPGRRWPACTKCMGRGRCGVSSIGKGSR